MVMTNRVWVVEPDFHDDEGTWATDSIWTTERAARVRADELHAIDRCRWLVTSFVLDCIPVGEDDTDPYAEGEPRDTDTEPTAEQWWNEQARQARQADVPLWAEAGSA